MTRTMLFFSALLTASACTSNDSSDGPTVGSSSSPDTGTAIIDDPDTGVPTDTGATTGAPDWVDPEVPEGPIAPPDGSGTDPEDSDFDWTGIGAATLADTFPGEHLTWNAYPQYGTAQILDWSDSDACVCFRTSFFLFTVGSHCSAARGQCR